MTITHVIQPFHLRVVALTGWLNRQQQTVIDYLIEETAATRSILNTAKVMEDNPTALRLKELETLEKVTQKVDKLTVFGGLDGVRRNTIQIKVNAE